MKLRNIAMAAVMALGVATVAKANTVELRFAGLTPHPNGWTWHYDAFLTNGYEVQDFDPSNVSSERDYAVFFNVDGYVAGTGSFSPLVAGAAYTLYSGQSWPGDFDGRASSSVAPEVDFQYTGSLIQNVSGAALKIGQFTFVSVFGTADPGGKAVTSDRLIGGGGDSDNLQTVYIPKSGGIDLTPLPAAAWGGVVVFGLLGVAGLRRQKAAVR